MEETKTVLVRKKGTLPHTTSSPIQQLGQLHGDSQIYWGPLLWSRLGTGRQGFSRTGLHRVLWDGGVKLFRGGEVGVRLFRGFSYPPSP